VDLILVCGVSGSGKSVALGALEDSGYYGAGNLPVSLIAPTAEYLCDSGQERVAMTVDLRIGEGASALPATIARLRDAGRTVRLLVLDTKTDTLVKRFSETRRRHPLSDGTRTLTEAIEHERALLADARGLGFAFDTSDLPAAALRAGIKDFVRVDAPPMCRSAAKHTRANWDDLCNSVMLISPSSADCWSGGP